MPIYSEKVMEHFMNPRNVGEIENPDGAIAVSSMVSEMAKGKTLEEAMKITPRAVADELEGLPKQKFHCSNLGAQALNKAIQDYLSKKKTKGGKE